MISIPISFLLSAVFIALLVSVLFWTVLPGVVRLCFAVLLGLLALEASLVGLRFALGVYDLLLLQRVLPVWIAPSAYMCFLAMTCAPDILMGRVLRHGAAASFATAIILAPIPLPGLIDSVIALSYLAYTALLTALWRRGPDVFSQVPTQLMHHIRQLLLAVILLFAATLIVDTVIALLFSMREVEAATRVISYATLGVLLGIISLGVWFGTKHRSQTESKPAEIDLERMAKTVDIARQLLLAQGFYKDPGLTLKRLARRTGVPDRDLSQAVNQIAHVSVSQFVNRIRLEEAARLLRATDEPVTRIQEKAGFLTRSNFYREFQKHFDMSPGAYRNKK